ncbi:YciI family protein [Marinospirillum alkaliphilum]|uniref:Uncharacterized conserved protein n=1 Tax=Marinospirillum alkaliphilum DSM 21637 TaxID=1122209 RepID=A0A1K1TJM8_9GAMM|nr:YciI family protein [Marinospirillum alkaliphilum]SFX00937.1 Uncharacterized conserved protein [Marinospirillum alkaliphilum DSM 21637]
MKYLALVYYQESQVNAMSEQEWHDLNQQCIGCVEGLVEKGKYLAGQALHPTDTATTLRMRNGELLISDGPFAETREQLAGFYLLDAQDLNEAIQLASKIPPARFGSVEIRPVRELPPKDPV